MKYGKKNIAHLKIMPYPPINITCSNVKSMIQLI